MRSYLYRLAQVFAKEVGKQVSDYTFVFPNRRAGLFFRKYLGESISQPILAPKILTINECFASLSDLRVADQLTLVLRLYSIYQQLRPNAEPLEDFLHWGKMMLADFSEVDNHLVSNVKALYTAIQDIHELNAHYDSLTPNQRKAIESFWQQFVKSKEEQLKHNKSIAMHQAFLDTWHLLYPLYEGLRENLLRDNIAYEGMLHRELISQWENIPEERFAKQYVFIGFNALTESERQLMVELQQKGCADFYFDYDSRFLSDKQNGASLFMKKNLEMFHSRFVLPKAEDESDIQISLTTVTTETAQVHQIHRILKDIGQPDDWTRTAIVLPDEDLLIPLLHGIPEEIEKINVTMGYPLRATASHKLIAYPEHFIGEPSNAQDFIHEMRKHIKAEANTHNTESTYQLLKIIDRIEQSISKYTDIHFSAESVKQILKMLAMDMSIPFVGEPLKGLQIMGVLETRALDFDNIIIANFNDELYPGQGGNNSFIPYTLRHGFDLPTLERKDAIFAYNFYRMLSYAKNVWLIANTQAYEMRSGELSRYYYQLTWQYNIPIQQTTIMDSLKTSYKESNDIPKDESTLTLLSKYLQGSSFSATALTDYLSCQKKFYYKHLRDIKEPEPDDTLLISDLTLGNVLHAIMEKLYKPFVGKQVQQSDIQQLMDDITDDNYWYQLEEIKNLKNDILGEKTIRHCVQNLLYYDYNHHSFHYVSSEGKACCNLPLSDGRIVKCYGKIDRVDILGGDVRIIDYKSGATNLLYEGMNKVFGLTKTADPNEFAVRDSGNKYVLQTLLYCMMVENDPKWQALIPQDTKLSAHLFSARKLHNVNAQTSIHDSKGDKDYAELKDEFKEALVKLIEEILSPEHSFHPTKDTRSCEDCPFASLCQL